MNDRRLTTNNMEPALSGLETARLAMRLLSAADELLYCGLYTDSETMRYIETPLSTAHAAQSFRKAIARSTQLPATSRIFAMFEKATRCAVGLCGIQQVDMHARSAEVGMMLKSEMRDRGYASEALASLVTTAFSAFPIDTVWVQYSPEHTAAERLVVGTGLKRCTQTGTGSAAEAKCVWSVDRRSWSSTYVANHRGEYDVERDQLS